MSSRAILRPHAVLALAIVLRAVLFFYGEWHDAHSMVKYTDVDYVVFTDAARFVHQGRSPYERSTYRYTPLLAWMLVPNITLHPAFGKALFAIADCFVGYLLLALLKRTQAQVDGADAKEGWLFDSHATALAAGFWLLNPMVANISTRGNAESLMGLLVVGTLYALVSGRTSLAAVVFGLAVHFKIYPIIYVLPILAYLRTPSQHESRWRWLLQLPSVRQIQFGLISATVFFALNGVMYSFYGAEFVEHTYSYHVVRKDHRHNFAAWFYHIYITYADDASLMWSLFAFVPQLTAVIALGLPLSASVNPLSSDLIFACFAQTFAFVTYNKVVTSQYFMWYLCLAPLALQYSSITLRWRGVAMIALWVLGQAVWLGFGYLLEFTGQPVFIPLWLAGLLFFGINNGILIEVVRAHRSPQPSKKNKQE